jgi:hypothetical protein
MGDAWGFPLPKEAQMEAAVAGLFIVALCVVGGLIPARHEIIPW